MGNRAGGCKQVSLLCETAAAAKKGKGGTGDRTNNLTEVKEKIERNLQTLAILCERTDLEEKSGHG